MFNHINNTNELPTLKEVETSLFRELQDLFQDALLSVLEALDDWIMDNRDFKRFENREKQKTTLATMFGEVPINRRKYLDRYTDTRVALLDQYLQYDGENSLSPFLAEKAVKWAVRGPSYRDARDRFCELLGYQATSHETIRQAVLEIQPEEIETDDAAPKKEKDVLFLEVDGLHVHKQNATRSSREVKNGIVHEGWEKTNPSSEAYKLKNKSYRSTLENGDIFWEDFSRYLYGKYEITEKTHIIINGDGAPWIRRGVDYFPNALYTYDRYHIKPWIKAALRNRTKKERHLAYKAADKNDPIALTTAVAEAEKAETDENKKQEIGELRLFILENQDAFRDYRDILKEKDKDLDTSWMRPMGSAESNMNLFSKRLKSLGYSWGEEGLKGMLYAMIHRFQGTLVQAIGKASSAQNVGENQFENYPSFATLLTEKTRHAIGAIQGHMPALTSSDQNKPYAHALRGLAGF